MDEIRFAEGEETWYTLGMSPVKRTRHAVYDLKYHLVWVLKYRRLALKDCLAKRLKKVFSEIADRDEFEIDTMEVKEDHVNPFLTALPRYSPSKIVQIMKVISAKVVFREFPEGEVQLWDGQLWSDGYFVRSVGDEVTSEVVRRYIKCQHQEL